MVTKQELNTLADVLDKANEMFTEYCDLMDTYVMDDEEIDCLEDDEERENAQYLKNYDTLLSNAIAIVEKLKKGE